MGHGRKLRRGYVEDATPELTADQCIGKVTELRDKGIVAVVVPSDMTLQSSLAYLPPRFRGVLFLRRAADSEQKVQWTIETLLRPDDVKQLRKDGEWPVVFDPLVNNVAAEEEGDEESEEDEEDEEDEERDDSCESNIHN